MDTTTTFDIQQQRIEERLIAAMDAAPKNTKRQINALRAKAEEALAMADSAEAKQVASCAALAALKQDRVNAAADLNELQQLAQGAANADGEAKNLIVRYLAGNRGIDPFAKSNFLLGLDAISRLKVIAHLLPPLLAAKQAAIERLDEELAKLGSSAE